MFLKFRSVDHRGSGMCRSRRLLSPKRSSAIPTEKLIRGKRAHDPFRFFPHISLYMVKLTVSLFWTEAFPRSPFEERGGHFLHAAFLLSYE